MGERGLVQAQCPTCGEVVEEASALSCGISELEETALCEFPCPKCDLVLTIPMAPLEISALLLLGAHETWSLPFELLERHSGAAVSWDEVLDLHLELEAHAFPQLELAQRRAA